MSIPRACIAVLCLAGTLSAQIEARAETALTWLSRVLFYYDSYNGGEQRPVQVVLENGAPRWKDERLRAWEELEVGHVWRLGSNWWSSLDTNARMRIGDQKLEPGRYLLAVRKLEAGAELLILDADRTLEKACDPTLFRPGRRERAVALTREEVPVKQDRLKMTIATGDEGADRGRLEIRFGPLLYHAPIEISGVKGTDPQQQGTARGRSRVVLWHGDEADARIVGQFTVGYPLAEWSAKKQQEIEELRPGGSWRPGMHHWTELTTTVPLILSGRKVRAGTYYAVLEKSRRGSGHQLVLLDADKLRDRKVDSMSEYTTKGGIPIALEAKTGEAARRLDVVLEVGPDGGVLLSVRFGTLVLQAPVGFAVG